MTLSRILSTTLAFGLVAGLAAADQATIAKNSAAIQKNAGIGLGTIIWSNFGDGLFSQVCAATTNGFMGTQTFAITSGTLGAEKPANLTRNEMREYMRGNMDSVARDVAAGRGESLDAVLDILAVDAAHRDVVTAKLQASFADIYASADVTHDVVADRMIAIATGA